MSVGRGLQDDLELLVLHESERVRAVAPVGRPARGLHVRRAPRLRSEDAQERGRMHRARAHLDVPRLLEEAALRRPVGSDSFRMRVCRSMSCEPALRLPKCTESGRFSRGAEEPVALQLVPEEAPARLPRQAPRERREPRGAGGFAGERDERKPRVITPDERAGSPPALRPPAGRPRSAGATPRSSARRAARARPPRARRGRGATRR